MKRDSFIIISAINLTAIIQFGKRSIRFNP